MVTIDIDDRLYHRMQIRAATDAVTITSIVEFALQRYLDEAASLTELPCELPAFELPVLPGAGGLIPGADLANNAALQHLSDLDTPLQRRR